MYAHVCTHTHAQVHTRLALTGLPHPGAARCWAHRAVLPEPPELPPNSGCASRGAAGLAARLPAPVPDGPLWTSELATLLLWDSVLGHPRTEDTGHWVHRLLMKTVYISV